MYIKWIIAAIATGIWLYFCWKVGKERHQGAWVTLGVHVFGKLVKKGLYTLAYAIFWIIWLIIF